LLRIRSETESEEEVTQMKIVVKKPKRIVESSEVNISKNGKSRQRSPVIVGRDVILQLIVSLGSWRLATYREDRTRGTRRPILDGVLL
jgi:hypothetical protein